MGQVRDRMDQDMVLRGFTANTRDTYLRCAAAFVQHFKQPPSKLGAEQIRAYLLHLAREKRRSASTIAVYVGALRFLFLVTLRRTDIELDDLPRPKIPARLPTVLAASEIERIFSHVPSLMHRAILFAAFGSGLRISEACRLRVDSIDRARKVLNVRSGKRNRDRTTLLGDRLLEALTAYWKVARPKGPYLFPSRNGAAGPTITRAAASIALKKAVAASGVTKRVTPHTLRHSFATHMIEGGTDLRTLQILLGHASIRSTVRYVHLTEARAGQLVSPLDKLQLTPTSTTTD